MSELRVACALLAAGSSRRLGRAKQLLPWRGTTLVRALARELTLSQARPLAVVLGAEAAGVAGELADLDLALLPNPAHGEGIAASLRVAVRWASVQRAEALILCAADQPFLTAAHIDALAMALARGAGTVASHYAGNRAIPAGFASSWFERLLELTGDRGAAALLRAAPDVCEVPWTQGAIDIDTADDWRRFCVDWPSQELVESDG